MIVIPRKYFHDEVIEQKLAETYIKIKESSDNIDGYKFNRENINRELFKNTEMTEERRQELLNTLEDNKKTLKPTLERIPYWIAKVDKWEAIKASTEDVVFDELDEVEALI